MGSIREIDTFEISRYINVFRKFLLDCGFFEHTLYSANQYNLENSDSFKLKDNLFLRYGTEPAVWNIGEYFDKFFWIGSLFRNEKLLTKIHNYEFKVLDFYIEKAPQEDILKFFFELLSNTEDILGLIKLSVLDQVFISYDSFNEGKFEKNGKYWLIVTDYPVEESFYDTLSTNKTNKFEIMFINSGEIIEIASGGIVGKNLNYKLHIKNDKNFVNEKIFDKKFIGLGFGIERLIFIYNQNKHIQ